MRTPHLRFALLSVSVLVLSARAADDTGFRPLVEGSDASQFELVAIGPASLQINDGVIAVSGKPNGYFATKASYRNYVLKFDWMYERPYGLASDADFDGNSGLLLHIEPPHKVWPKCIEAQLQNKDAGNTFAINGAKFMGKKDSAAQKTAIKPVGQWNQEEVTCQNGEIVCKINGIEVARGTGASPDHGQIGWQSEGRPIKFRNLMLKPMD
jgi:3-keto-disaccharide hydrolase